MSNKEVDLDNITNLLAGTTLIPDSGVTFAGKSLKLNTENDAKEVIEGILSCKTLTYLNLEGNTLGIDAAKGIAKALESHPEFKRALWKDIFTGRLKEEIPDALRFLGSGLQLAGAKLMELDMSDNAFGPIGVEGLASLLKSPCCYALEELKLNNNGLGISGGKLLAKALMKCYEDSKSSGKPLALKVFIAGRNRLENEGAKALSEVFKTLKSLEKISMPQNGIYHHGVTALATAFKENKNLRVLDLNDNTVGSKGSAALANVLPDLHQLTCLNLGDCLLKTSGGIAIASALSKHEYIQEVNLSFNEINKSGGLAICDVLASKPRLASIILGGNMFGEDTVNEIKKRIKSISKDSTINISDDEGSDNDDEESKDEVSEVSDSCEDDEEDDNKRKEELTNKFEEKSGLVQELNHSLTVNAEEFLRTPTPEKFMSLGKHRTALIIDEIQKQPEGIYLETLLSSLMKVSSLSTSNNDNIKELALECSNVLYQEMFTWANANDKLSIVNNSLLVHLGLLKSEDKKFKALYNTEACKNALNHAMTQNFFPQRSMETINLFLKRQVQENIPIVVL